MTRSFCFSSFALCVCGSPYEPCFMIYVHVYASFMGRQTILVALKRRRERRCVVCFLFVWLAVARSFILIIYNDRKRLFSSLSHTLAFFLSFSKLCFSLPRMSLFIFYISVYFPFCLSLLSGVEFLTGFSVALWWTFTHGYEWYHIVPEWPRNQLHICWYLVLTSVSVFGQNRCVSWPLCFQIFFLFFIWMSPQIYINCSLFVPHIICVINCKTVHEVFCVAYV